MKPVHRWGRRVACTVVAAAVAASFAPASALALGNLQSWTAPTSKLSTDGYVTSSGHKVTESTADILGISNTTVVPTAGNPFTYEGTAQEILASVSQSARFGVFGTDVNEAPNPYYNNYFYNVSQNAGGGTNLADDKDIILIDTSSTAGPFQADTVTVDAYGTSAALYKRPNILYGAQQGRNAMTDAAGNAVDMGPAYSGADVATTSGYSQLVAKIRNKELSPYNDTDLYQAGDENYNPYYVSYTMTAAGASSVNNIYNLADAAEAIMKADSTKKTRYGDPVEIAKSYEAFLRGTQYAVLKAIDEGTVERRTVAIVESVDTEKNTIKLMVSDASAADNGKGNLVNYTVENVTNNIIDKNSIADPAAAKASDIMGCDAILINGYSGMGDGKAQNTLVENLTQVLKNGGFDDSSAYPPMCVIGPKTIIHAQAYSPENTVYTAYRVGFVYPEVINPVYALAYYYENFYHVKESRLADALGMNLAAISLPSVDGKALDLSLEGYSKDDYEDLLTNGIGWYEENKAAVDAAYPKLAATSRLDMPTSIENEYSYGWTMGSDVYNGKTKTAKVSVEAPDGKALVEGTDFKVTGNKAKNAGTYTITITGRGSYYGTLTTKFTIVKAAQKIKIATAAKSAKAGKTTSKVKVTGATGKVSYAKAGGAKQLTINSSTGKIKVAKSAKKGKTYKIKVKATAKATTNYKKGTATATIKVKVK